ncbi:hypothetical protein AAG906_018901 [Vitis piasezkii]
MRNHPSEPKSSRNVFLPKLFQTSVNTIGPESPRHQLGTNQMAPLSGCECQVVVIPLLSTCDFHHKLLCMPKWIRDSGGRLVKCDTPQEKELESPGRQDNPNEFRSMRDRMHPPRMSAPSCIVPPTEQLVIRPYLVPLLPTFHGMESENPYAHIKEFEDKFFPTHRTNGLKRQISNFSAKENEKFYECWERYMEAINACPHHGFDTWLLGWDEPTKGEVGKMKSQLNAYNEKAGMYALKEDDDMKAKMAAMTRRLEELELKRIHEVQAVAEAPVQLKCVPIVDHMNIWWRNACNFI